LIIIAKAAAEKMGGVYAVAAFQRGAINEGNPDYEKISNEDHSLVSQYSL